LFTVVLAVVAAGALAYYGLGYSWTTPTDLANARDELVIVRQRNATLEAELVELQDRTDELTGRVDSGAEAIDELLPQVQALQGQATEISRLGGDLRENMAVAATLQADTSENQAAVEALATVQADTSEQVDELSESTDRMVRFLDRLSNIAEDTAGSINPSNTPTPTLTATPTPTPTLTPTRTPTETVEATLEPTEAAEGTPEPTDEEEAEGTPEPTPTTDN
jgi:chromosome segregation ATPase